MQAAVVVFPGTNRERDMARALQLVSGRAPAMVWHAESSLPAGTDLVVIPGGFSYGDYLRCGAIAARAPVMDAVRIHAAKRGLVLGICNGFQILCEAGMLPGVLMRNAGLKFICREMYLKVERSDTPFTRGYNAGQVTVTLRSVGLNALLAAHLFGRSSFPVRRLTQIKRRTSARCDLRVTNERPLPQKGGLGGAWVY